MMKTIAVFASGTGSNFAALTEFFGDERRGVRIAMLVCDHKDAPVVPRRTRLTCPSSP